MGHLQGKHGLELTLTLQHREGNKSCLTITSSDRPSDHQHPARQIPVKVIWIINAGGDPAIFVFILLFRIPGSLDSSLQLQAKAPDIRLLGGVHHA